MDPLAAWWANLLLRRPDFEAKYPILGTRKVEIIDAGNWMTYWVNTRHSFDDSSQQLSAYFGTIAGNDPNADPPTSFNWTLPGGTPTEAKPGIEYMMREIRREVVAMSNYAPADGEALGFEAIAKSSLNPQTLKPTIQAFAAATNYHFAIVVTGREGITMWDVYILRNGGSWTKVETCSGKSADISVASVDDKSAEQIQVRVQLRKNNADIGQPSDPVYVTLNP